MLQNASLDSVIYCLALGNKFVCLACGNKFVCLACGNKFVCLALGSKFVCLACGNKFVCLALGNKFVMNQTFYTKEGDQHFVALTETVIIFNENNTYMSSINSVLLLQVLPSCDVFGVAVLTGFLAELMEMQRNSINVMSDNCKVLIIWYLMRVVLRPEVLLFYQKDATAMKQADTWDMFRQAFKSVCTSDTWDMFRKALKSVCTSTIVVSFDPLSPILLASSVMQDSKKYKRVP